MALSGKVYAKSAIGQAVLHLTKINEESSYACSWDVLSNCEACCCCCLFVCLFVCCL